jgi:hypothetical protein
MKPNNLFPQFSSVLLGIISVFFTSQPLMAQPAPPPFPDGDRPRIDSGEGRHRPPFLDDRDHGRYSDRDRPPFLSRNRDCFSSRNRPPFLDRDCDTDRDRHPFLDRDRYSDRDRHPFLDRN